MRAMSLPIPLVRSPGAGALAEETPSPALLVLNKGHRGSTRPSELAIVDPGSGRVVARIPTGIESHEVAVSPDGKLAVVTNTGPYSDSGSTDLSDRGDYVRIDGPRVWIEFAAQGSDQIHTIWRDRLTDYGAEFSY
jgi:DNA-binding beta-propeller fold protein YncE